MPTALRHYRLRKRLVLRPSSRAPSSPPSAHTDHRTLASPAQWGNADKVGWRVDRLQATPWNSNRRLGITTPLTRRANKLDLEEPQVIQYKPTTEVMSLWLRGVMAKECQWLGSR